MTKLPAWQRLPTRSFVALGTALAVGLLGFAFAGADAQEETVEIHKTASAQFSGFDGPVFIAIVGTDDRPGVSGARADAMHLVGINPQLKAGTILNIPRDTYTEIPGHGTRKINESHSTGGAELVAQTLQTLTGAPVQFVITTNFEGFTNIVNEAGGVAVDLPIPVVDQYSGANLAAGPNHLPGDVALAFSRSRKSVPRGDFTRTSHQGLLLWSALKQVQGEQAAGTADLVKDVAILLRHLKTTSGVSPADLYQLARLAMTIPPENILNITMPGVAGSAGAASVVYPTEAAAPLFADFVDDGVVQAPPAEDGAGNTFGP